MAGSYPPGMVVSIEIAKRLRDAGVVWQPRRFDFFHIPDRNLDEELFVIANFAVNVQHLADGIAAIAFEGAVEWSLDYILTQDVVWMPSETQAREMLGEAFLRLEQLDGNHQVTITHRGHQATFSAPTPSDAYGLAMLHLLASSV